MKRYEIPFSPSARRLLCASIVLFVAAGAPAHAQITNYYVSEAVGDNSYDGLSDVVTSGDGPKLNVSYAISVATSGSTIRVDAGEYSETVWDLQTKSLTLVPQGTVNICGPDLCDVDSVGDGIPDWWRLQYFGAPTTTNANSCAYCNEDADGYSNLQEYHLGGDPTDPTSYPTNLPANLVAWWRLDEGVGTNVFDSSLNNRSGFLEGGNPASCWTASVLTPPCSTSLVFSNAVTFSGVPTNWVRVPYSSGLIPTNQFTMTAWVETPDDPGGTATISSRDAAGTRSNFELDVTDGGSVFAFGDSSNEYPNVVDYEDPNYNPGWAPSSWHHLAGVYDGTNVSLYVDGGLVGSRPITNSPPDLGNPVWIGSSDTNFDQGSFNDVRIYSRALSPTEVVTVYHGDVPLPPSPPTPPPTNDFVIGSARYAATVAIDANLTLPATNTAIYSAINHFTTNYVRNPACWAAGFDLTCLAVFNTDSFFWYTNGLWYYSPSRRGGTLISPRHVIFTEHFAITNGATLRFVARDNTVVSRVLSNSMPVPSRAWYVDECGQTYYVTNMLMNETDLQVGVLDSDVPTNLISFAKVLPSDYQTYFPNLLKSIDSNAIPALCPDQYENAKVTDIGTVGAESAEIPQITFESPSDSTEQQFYGGGRLDGDSGQPAFVVINGQLVIVTVWTGQKDWPGYGHLIYDTDSLNSVMTNLGGGYTLTPVDLSGFTRY